MVRAEHPGNAVRAARDIQKSWRERREALVAAHGLTASELGIGIGIHSGELSFGEFGHTHRDLTAIGTVVNRLSRPVGCRSRPDPRNAGGFSALPT
jgi:class 3 adenylate cyclase